MVEVQPVEVQVDLNVEKLYTMIVELLTAPRRRRVRPLHINSIQTTLLLQVPKGPFALERDPDAV